MSDIFKKVKSIFDSLKSFMSPYENKQQDPYDKLVDRFKNPKPLDVSELEEIKALCKQVTEEGAHDVIDSKFDILKDIMFEKVVDGSCRSKITVEDKKIKSKKEYKEFIRKEYKRMICSNTEEEKKEVKRVKKNTQEFKNEVSWGILPDKWRMVRASAPFDVVEYAINNNDDAKGPVLVMGDVPSDQEESYFTEEYITELYKRSRSQNIICDLYNPETNCRKCIRYEFNQERLKNIEDKMEREKNQEDALHEDIRSKAQSSEKLIQKTSNPEDKVWYSFLFKRDFKFSDLSENEKNLFFSKLKKSGVLCMDALEGGVENNVNNKTKDFATKRELFDIEDNQNVLLQGSVFDSKNNSEKEENVSANTGNTGILSRDNLNSDNLNRDILNSDNLNSDILNSDNLNRDILNGENDLFGERHKVFNFSLKQENSGEEKDKITTEFVPKGEESNKEENKESAVKNEIKFEAPKLTESSDFLNTPFNIKESPKETPEENVTSFKIDLPPPIFDIKNESEKLKSEGNKIEGNKVEEDNKIEGNKIEDNKKSEEASVKIPQDWHFFPKYPAEVKQDSSINPENKTHPPVFNRSESTTLSSVKCNLENKPNPFLSTFLPNNNLSTPSGPFSFTPPSNNFLSPTATNVSPSGPSKRKRDDLNLNQNVNLPTSFTNLDPKNVSPSPFGSMLQTPALNNNPEFNKLVEMKQNSAPFLGEVPNPFQTSNPLQHSRNDNLNFVDNTFKYNDVFNKSNQNLFLNSKSMFDDLIFENSDNNNQETSVKYLTKKDDKNGAGSLFGSNLFGNDNDPWNK
ncbi:hypothetical protein NGRA_1963 [Nosema granulosis]|uniref:Uncharacterized protein n=1 Tax=Nosema granulosis TaxID=83296 RepID=A0A9P6KY54_9MICR|nr:hypothetical protein NGRA_1963 [Nosema granulosis]